jgi:hypothetical protein
MLCALAIGLAVGTLLGAVFLRWAVALYNKIALLNNMMAGGDLSRSSVPYPAFGKAMWITFETSVFQLIAGLLIFGLFRGDGAAASGARGRVVDDVAQLLFVPVSFLITLGVLSAKLPTTFGRAILVTLCDMLLVLLVVGVLVAIAVLVFGVALWGP